MTLPASTLTRYPPKELSSSRFSKEAQPKPQSDYLPYYSLAIAAGGFLAGDAPEPEGWVNRSENTVLQKAPQRGHVCDSRCR